MQCDVYDFDRESLRRNPRCRGCYGRDTAWVPASEDDPRERLVCFTCDYATPPRTCTAQLYEQHDVTICGERHACVSWVCGVSPWIPRSVDAGAVCG